MIQYFRTFYTTLKYTEWIGYYDQVYSIKKIVVSFIARTIGAYNYYNYRSY